MIEGSAVNVE